MAIDALRPVVTELAETAPVLAVISTSSTWIVNVLRPISTQLRWGGGMGTQEGIGGRLVIGFSRRTDHVWWSTWCHLSV